MCRQGVSHDYQYFAYKGALIWMIIGWTAALCGGGAPTGKPPGHAPAAGVCYKSPNDFRDALYGGRRKKGRQRARFHLFIWSINRMLLPIDCRSSPYLTAG